MRSRNLFVRIVLGVGAALAPAVCLAADGDDLRFSGGIGLGATYRLHSDQGHGLEIDNISQTYGFSFGVELNRYVAIEAVAHQSQTDLYLRGIAIGEYGTFSLIPQVRLRYPLLDGRLAPYVVAGVGVSHNEFGDRKGGGDGLSIHARDTRVAGAVGVGVEYRVADNVGIGAELQYLISRGHEIEIEGARQTLNLDALIAQARLRILFPERDSQPEAAYLTDGRFYLAVRYGGSVTTHERIADDLESHPALDSIGGAVDQLIAFSVGWDFARHLGVDLALGGYSPRLVVPGVGSVAEYAVYYAIPQLRARFPLLGGRLVPYLLAGVGGSYMEVKDRKTQGRMLGIRGDGVSVVGAVGAGLDYMVASNIGLGVELEYVISRGHSMTVGDGRSQSVDLDALLMTGGLRIYFGKSAAR